MKEVLILPIDDRPCHNDFILEATSNINEYKLNMVPKSFLGHFSQPGNTEKISEYLLQYGKTADYLIVSIDSLLYGGLVQARTMNYADSLVHYEKRLSTLNQLKKMNPKLKIYAYSVIIRLTTTVTNSKELKSWEDIFEYSQLVHRVKEDKEYIPLLHDVKKRIPEKLLNDYLDARKRNHYFNQKCVELVKDETIDYLTLVQEDTHPYGMHIEEQKALISLIEAHDVCEKTSIKNGTDEMVALLLARILNKGNKSFVLDTEYLDPNYIAKFEDQPILKNIYASLEVANMHAFKNDAQDVFLVLPAENKSIDLAFEPLQKTVFLSDSQLSYYQKYDGKRLYVLDVQYSNGGDIRALERLLMTLPHADLCGYSAWNTGSNSIGTLILDLVIGMYYQPNQTYIRLRVIDDAVYQGIVRTKVNEYMRAHNLDVWADNKSDALTCFLNHLLNDEIKKYHILKGRNVQAKLPWGRSFEVLLKEKCNDEI